MTVLSGGESLAGQRAVALVSMPWPLFYRPSVQLGALKAFLAKEAPEYEVRCFHPYLEVASRLGGELYQAVCGDVWLGEALYAPLVFPAQAKPARQLAARRLRRLGIARAPAELTSLLAEQLAEWLAGQEWQNFGLVGFSLCFNQLFASLAAIRALKRLRPEVAVVVGGAACGGDAGRSLLATFPEIDFVIPAEGELPLLGLCRFLAGESDRPGAGVLARGWAEAAEGDCQLSDLARLPVPDFDEYFQEMNRWFSATPFRSELVVEFSRGCWWGKCAFCNLNLQWRGFRAKDHDQLWEEVTTLADRHGCLDFCFADNVLPTAEARKFFDVSAASGRDYRFFAEIRPRQGVDLAACRAGGLAVAQAGIEALSTSLLGRMGKGASTIENIALLRDALAKGVRLEGNLIVEFPGSTGTEVAETLSALDFVWPFPALASAAFFLGYGSPMARNPARYGIRAVTFHPRYRQLVPPEARKSLTLLLQGWRGDRGRQRRLWAPVVAKIRSWQRFHQARRWPALARPLLSFRDGGGFLVIRQELPSGAVLHHRLRGDSRGLYLACQRIVSLDRLAAEFPALSKAAIQRFLEGLVQKRLVFQEGSRYLSLAVREGDR